MKITIVIGFFFLIPFFSIGQINLVPNPGFDSIINCSPTTNYLNCYDWYKINGGTPDNFNSCFSNPNL